MWKHMPTEQRESLGGDSNVRAKVGLCRAYSRIKMRKVGVLMSKKASIRRIESAILSALLILALVFSAAGCSSAGKKASGAEAFRQYYTRKAQTDTEHDYSHMDLGTLEAMAAAAPWKAVDTEELTIEAVGAIVGGDMAEVILRVTAKHLDTVLCDDGKASQNYRFGDESAALMMKYNFESLSCRYYYCDEDDSLEPNQFELHYWIAQEPLTTEQCTIELTDFGCYDSGVLSPLYTGSWTVDVSLVPASETGREINLDESVTVGDHKFRLETIRLAPLGCAINMSCEEDEAYVSEHFDEIYEAFLNESQKCVLSFADGSEWNGGQFSIENSSSDDFRFFISFLSPTAIDDITSLTIFENDFSL